jgi:hypothetical protein
MEVMWKRNLDFEIEQEKKQINNDLHVSLFNEITDLDKIPMNTEIVEVKADDVVEHVREKQEVVERMRNKEMVLDDNK